MFSQDAQSLKAKITKSFNQRLASLEISPTEGLPEPQSDGVPRLAEALRERRRIGRKSSRRR